MFLLAATADSLWGMTAAFPSSPTPLPPLIPLAIVSAIYASGMLVAAGGRLRTLFASNLRDNLSVSIGEASLGVVLASAYTSQRWIVLPFLVPLLGALYNSGSTLTRLKRETAAA